MDGLVIERLEGAHPITAEGTVGGHRFSFWAKRTRWTFGVALDPSVDAADVGNLLADGSTVPGFCRSGAYDDHGAGFTVMTPAEAVAIIERCAAEFPRSGGAPRAAS